MQKLKFNFSAYPCGVLLRSCPKGRHASDCVRNALTLAQQRSTPKK
ncbi:MAG: hypothetical protein NZ519_09880 [Bacteroidia bacterium]|nr:hypothetical protein [Bacteroidia bacterium]MDW8301039.1 hypothetical protein [Bacteroidia bacterium]